MKTSEVNKSLVGKRVNCIFSGEKTQGTIIDIVSYSSPTYNRETRFWDGPEVEVSRGVKIRLDKPVCVVAGDFNTESWWQSEFESTARIFDDWGNLSHVELID